ncbi:cation diffusion facilitator family transporter [Methylorubrum thiocyanatum]|uniref:cation diffusion facilitator family transporter n=1 Tax=Methylorubrum thiocyanatum TaxID=47958 RepID=UPI0035C82C94
MTVEHDHAEHADGPGHVHAPASFGTAFAVGVGLNTAYVVLEASFGLLSGSLALLADAGHNLSDVLGLLIGWGASWLSNKPPTPERTYGYKRAPILASLANAVILFIAVGGIAWEAVRRLTEPASIESGTILWVAVVGVLVNAGTAWLFMRGRKGDLNIRGAFLHMAADAGVTVGVIVAALVIGWTGWQWLDPAISLVIAAVILASTWGLLRDAVQLSLDTVPPNINAAQVRSCLEELPGVAGLHDLHIWPLSTTETALTAHLVLPKGNPGDSFLLEATNRLRERFGIGHVTLQIETGPESGCALASSTAV